MSAAERFRLAWNSKFPSEPAPDLPCLYVRRDQVDAGNGSVYGTVYSNLDPAAVEHTLQTCNATIAQLYLQLERQQFVAEYLWEVLHGISTATASVSSDECELTPPVPVHSKKTSVRVKDRAVAISLKADVNAAGLPNTGLDNIIPIDESPSSCNFSPLSLISVDGKVFPDDKTSRLTNEPVLDSNSTDMDKCQQITRKHSLPLIDHEQNDPEFESVSERTCSLDSDLDSNLQNKASVPAVSGSTTVTPVNSFHHQHLSPSASLAGQKPYRQKPVPTPRVTVNKQAAPTVVSLGDAVVGSSSTDDITSLSGNDQLQRESKHIGESDSFSHLSRGSAGSESVSSGDDEQKVRSVKERALAFTLSMPIYTSPSAPGIAQKQPANENDVPSADSGSSVRRAGMRRTERVHVYEEVVPVKPDVADLDETGAVSSDDEEPLYYNIKMLQQNMLNRAKTFYSKGAQRPVTERTKELDAGSEAQTRPQHLTVDDTHHLSSDSSKYLYRLTWYICD